MLKFSGHGGVAGKIKVKPDYSKIPLWTQKLEKPLNQSFLDLSKAAYDASHSMNDFSDGMAVSNYSTDDYIIRIYPSSKGENAMIYRKSDAQWISFYRNVESFYNPMKDTEDFALRFIHGEKSTKVGITVTSQVLLASNLKHLKLMMIENMASKISDMTGWDIDELRVLIENFCIFPHLPYTKFSGILYDSHSGKSYVKNATLPEYDEEYLTKFKGQFITTGPIKNTDYSNSISEISKNLPGVMQTKLDCPHCHIKDSLLWNLVQHLNDKAEWSREKIADWLDELADDGRINIDFAPWGEEPVEVNIPKLSYDSPYGEAEEIVAQAMTKLTPQKASVIALLFKEMMNPTLEQQQVEHLIGNINLILGEAYANKN